MGGVLGVVLLAVGLVMAVRGLPLIATAVEGRRIEVAARERDVQVLRRAVAGAAGRAELSRVLRRLRTRELLELGDAMVETAGEDSGVQVLAALTEVIDSRVQVLERWARVRGRRDLAEEGSAGGTRE
jgi:hypothetical protein